MEGKDLGYFTKKKIIFWKLVSVLKLLVEQTDTGCYNLCWLTVLEKKGLHQEAYILENYGIDSETDLTVLDFSKLVSRGIKTFRDSERFVHRLR
jgi:hypothetical protein